MKFSVNKLAVFGVLVSVMALAFSSTASAHVVVKPAEVISAGFQTFTIGVPNEKDISTTSVKLIIPDGLKYVQPTQKEGWRIDIESEGAGLDATVKSITWSGNEVMPGFRDDFTFSGQVPENATTLQWKAYQTYADGTVVSWDKAASGDSHESKDENSGPFSVTNVVTETADNVALKSAEQSAVDAKNAASTALYIAIAGVLVGLLGVFAGTRKK